MATKRWLIKLKGGTLKYVRYINNFWQEYQKKGISNKNAPQLEGPTTKIYNYVLGGILGEKAEEIKEDWQRLLAQVPIFKKKRIIFIWLYIKYFSWAVY